MGIDKVVIYVSPSSYMPDSTVFSVNKLNQKGVVHLLVPVILILGLIAGVYILTSGNPLKLFSKASNPPIVFKTIDGKTLPVNSRGIYQTTSPNVRVELTSPLGASSTVSGPTTRGGTVSYRTAFNPADLNRAMWDPYLKEPTVYTVSLQNVPAPQFYWVEFKDKSGRVDRRSVQVQVVSAPVSGPIGSPPPQVAKRVFVTSTTYNGNLGGLSGADAKCQVRAKAASLGGTWKAWLSDSKTSAASRLTHNSGPYKSIFKGVVVANSWTDLTDGALTNSIAVNEDGAFQAIIQPFSVWAGTRVNGYGATEFGSKVTCGDWTSSSPSANGIGGAAWKNDSDWTWVGTQGNPVTQPCNTLKHLYCFEQ